MAENRAEIVGWILALIMVAIMGFVAFAGPFHAVKKTSVEAAAARAGSMPPVHVTINTANTKEVGIYKPSVVTAHVGQTVIFTNSSNADHTVTARNQSFDSGNIPTAGAWHYIPTKNGTFKYYCLYHQYMSGTLVVKP